MTGPKPVSSDLYDTQYYEKFNHGYSSYLKNKEIMPELKKVLETIVFREKAVLDIGCGRGEFLRYAKSRGAKRVVGIDYSASAVQIAKDTLKDLDEDVIQIEVLQMDAKKLDFPNESLDVVVLLDVVEHLHDWELKECFNEVHRVLRSGGEVVIHTSPNKIMLDLVRVITNLVGVKLKSSEFHVNEQTYFSLRNYISDKFKGKLFLEKDVHYWQNQMDLRGNFLKNFAKIVDSILDFYPMHKLLSLPPFTYLFSTDIWFIGKKK